MIQRSDNMELFQLDIEIVRTIASFIKISSGHSLIIKLIFIKFFRTISEIGGQISWNQHLAESLGTLSPIMCLTNPFLFLINNKF